jgi:hypothetical protein
LGGYLNFGAWFMKNVSLEQRKIKLRNKWHFVENKTDYAACLKSVVNFIVA